MEDLWPPGSPDQQGLIVDKIKGGFEGYLVVLTTEVNDAAVSTNVETKVAIPALIVLEHWVASNSLFLS